MSIFTTKLRTLVSQDRIRHEELSLNIDLTYITDRILAMSFPATGIEAAWRNDIQDIVHLLQSKHKDNYLIWNLSERHYQYELLDNQIVCFPFKDHHAPPLHIIFQIIHHIDSWLKANPQHVAIVHCMGGKGRTGLIIVCFLFYSGLSTNVAQCLSYFAARRSAKAKGVTQPSQLRYVKYFSEVVSGARTIMLAPLCLQYVTVGPVPKGIYVYVEFYQQVYAEVNDAAAEKVLYSSYAGSESRVTDKDGRFWSECNVELSGDILVRGYYVEGKSKPKYLFRLQFHTGMLESLFPTFNKDELDDLHKEKKKFPSDFELKFGFVATAGDRKTIVMYNTIFNQMRSTYIDMKKSKPYNYSQTEDENWLKENNDGACTNTSPTLSPCSSTPSSPSLSSSSSLGLVTSRDQQHLSFRQHRLQKVMDRLEQDLAVIESLVLSRNSGSVP